MEEKAKKAMNEVISIVQESHLQMLESNLKAIEKAFLKGIEIGKELKDN